MKHPSHVHVINLLEREDRYHEVTHEMKRIGIENIKWIRNNRHPEGGAVGCCQAHLQALRSIVEGESDYGIVFEDDILFTEDFIQQHENKCLQGLHDTVEGIDGKWDIVYFGSRTVRDRGTDGKYRRGTFLQTHAIAVTRQTAEKILKLNPKDHIDIFLASQKIDAVGITPSICIQRQSASDNKWVSFCSFEEFTKSSYYQSFQSQDSTRAERAMWQFFLLDRKYGLAKKMTLASLPFLNSTALAMMHRGKDDLLQWSGANLWYNFITMWGLITRRDRQAYRSILGIFVLGMLVEIAGVQRGWIFGSYKYGDRLGRKLAGVPVTIGLMWVMLSCTTHSLVSTIPSRAMRLIGGTGMMVGLDWIIEPLAPKLGFWKFDRGSSTAPLSNFIGWTVVSAIMQCMIGDKPVLDKVTSGVLYGNVIGFYAVAGLMERLKARGSRAV